ncbi:hypothetical protein [Lentzea jiangxiensis]|uniref:Translation initiation factor IF-2 n=1 Tax=Lentzea jiangxiensis TaxID=641025 RepID=A0A1H0X4N6_9PSEU|nr:hypothetical protein [Lentzea jiangxiensis]SDP97446.1 translation initiation factor IF-2 [Lentzea jiangxiensis]
MSSETQQNTGAAAAAAAAAVAPPTVPVTPPDTESDAPATQVRTAGGAPAVLTATKASTTSAAKSNRVSRPMIVAAAVAGVVLVALPVAFGGLLANNDGPGDDPNNAGYAYSPPPGDGFVPGVADPKVDNTTDQSQAPSDGSVPGQPGQPGTPNGQQGQQADPGTPGTPGTPGQPQKPGSPQGQPQGQNPPANQPPPAKPVVYQGTAGPGCGSGTNYTGVGAYSDGKAGWVNHGSGCGNAFASIPMSGDESKDDPTAYGLWTFNTGPVTTGTCTLSVYVPNGDITAVGGNPTYYQVYDRFEISKGTPIGSFQVKQVSNRGKWLTFGSFRVNGAKLAVKLLTRGRDWEGSTKTYAHHAAGAITAKCQA